MLPIRMKRATFPARAALTRARGGPIRKKETMCSQRRCFLLLAAILAWGCGSNDDATDPSSELPLGSIVGTIDGTSWSTATAFALFANGRLTAAGTGSQNLTFGFGVSAVTPGNYSVGAAGNASGSLADGLGSVWEATVAGGSGTVTITSAAGNEVTGTFAFTLARSSGSASPATRSVTNGRFHLRY
jgi:hypothetical protein